MPCCLIQGYCFLCDYPYKKEFRNILVSLQTTGAHICWLYYLTCQLYCVDWDRVSRAISLQGPIHSHDIAPTRLAGTKICKGVGARPGVPRKGGSQRGAWQPPLSWHPRVTCGGWASRVCAPTPLTDSSFNQPSWNDIMRVHGTLIIRVCAHSVFMWAETARSHC